MNIVESRELRLRDYLIYLFLLLIIVPLITGTVSDYYKVHYLSETEVAVLGLTDSVDSIIAFMSSIMAFGGYIICSKAIGKGDSAETSANYTSLLMLEVIPTGIISFLLVFFRYPVAGFIGASESNGMLESCADAVAAYGLGIPGYVLLMTLSYFAFLDDRVRKYIVPVKILEIPLTLIANHLVTITAPTVFAYLTCGIIVDWVSVALFCYFIRKHSEIFRFTPKDISPRKALHMLVIGLPEGMENVYYSLNRYFIYLYILGKFSEKYKASIEISGDISVIEDTLVFGMTLIFIERVGSSVGSGNSERERKDFKKLWIICIAGSLIFMVFLFFLYRFLADFYIGDYGADTEEILYHAKYFLSAYALSFPLYIANHLFVSTYDLREMIWHMHIIRFLEFVGLLVLYSHLLGDTLGIIGIWIAYPVTEATVLIINILLVIIHYRRLPSFRELGYIKEKASDGSVLGADAG